jgi:glucose/arabinose dehydrogenase
MRLASQRCRQGNSSASARRVIKPSIERLEPRDLLATLPPGFIETPVATGLTDPTATEFAPNGDLWVLEQGGLVKRFGAGSATADVVGNIANLGLNSAGERGVLGIAFDPQYATNKEVYLYYTSTTPAIHNRVSRFTVNDSDAADYYFVGASTSGADAGATGTPTATVIFDLNNLSSATNHNGGAIHFGPDGKLYIAAGENANPPNSQVLTNVLGKILRINSDGTIPSDNPFFHDTTGKGQAIFALGLRNPYTFAFQPGTGRMFINDVGQDSWEEIDDGVAGSNYGWPDTEGNTGTPPTSPGSYRGPLYTYAHGSDTFEGEAITGGAFYNSTTQQFPAEYAGEYFFADYINGWIHVFNPTTGDVTEFATGIAAPIDLHVTGDGSLYYLARDAGEVMRVSFPPQSFPWQNPQNAIDVNADGFVFPNDALIIINIINAFGSHALPTPTPGNSPPPYLDVVADNVVAPNDALAVINYINAHPPGEGEEKSVRRVSDVSDLASVTDLVAMDVAEQAIQRRRSL